MKTKLERSEKVGGMSVTANNSTITLVSICSRTVQFHIHNKNAFGRQPTARFRIEIKTLTT